MEISAAFVGEWQGGAGKRAGAWAVKRAGQGNGRGRRTGTGQGNGARINLGTLLTLRQHAARGALASP
jgi:hypothetical protein